MSNQGYYLFLRIQTGSGKGWYEEQPERLATQRLDAELDGCSVYKVSNDTEEPLVAAAHFATFNKNKIERIFGLKVDNACITQAGLTLQNTPGSTGFAFIDQKHFDITGSKDQFTELARQIVKKLKAGANLIRYFEEPQIAAILKDFLNNQTDQMQAGYRDKVVKCLGAAAAQTSQ